MVKLDVNTKFSQLKNLLKRNRFSGLMSLYDSNYHAFMRLMPDLGHLPVLCCSRIDGSPDLYLEVLERCKFTTIVRLTYYFEIESAASGSTGRSQDSVQDTQEPDAQEQTESQYIPDPDLIIRIYHDARVVEAVSCQKQGFMPIGTSDPHNPQQLHCRWESNLFLQKWLQYTLESGHRFSLKCVNELQELPCIV